MRMSLLFLRRVRRRFSLSRLIVLIILIIGRGVRICGLGYGLRWWVVRRLRRRSVVLWKVMVKLLVSLLLLSFRLRFVARVSLSPRMLRWRVRSLRMVFFLLLALVLRWGIVREWFEFLWGGGGGVGVVGVGWPPEFYF